MGYPGKQASMPDSVLGLFCIVGKFRAFLCLVAENSWEKFQLFEFSGCGQSTNMA